MASGFIHDGMAQESPECISVEVRRSQREFFEALTPEPTCAVEALEQIGAPCDCVSFKWRRAPLASMARCRSVFGRRLGLLQWIKWKRKLNTAGGLE
jgi:hypothetical protein